MINRLLADAVMVLHLMFILFVALGGLLVLRRKWVAWLHLPAAVWGAAISLVGWTCPLTPLENLFRRRAGGAGYEGGFVEHHIAPLVYMEGAPEVFYTALGIGVIVVNAVVYGWAWRR